MAANLVDTNVLIYSFDRRYPLKRRIAQEVLKTALRGASMYGLSWYDAHLWAHAEVHGLGEIYSEDFELPCMYEAAVIASRDVGALRR